MDSNLRTQGERLKWAREKRGFTTGSEAARAMGIQAPTYLGHENGNTPITRAAERYAKYFGVSLEWLLTGRGDYRNKHATWALPIAGKVGAGASIEPISDAAGLEAPDSFTLPSPDFLGGLIVEGDSQLPRYLPGELIIYDTRPVPPQKLTNQMAIVHCLDGRRLVKMIRKGTLPNLWSLESLNAAIEEDVALQAAYEIKGSLKR